MNSPTLKIQRTKIDWLLESVGAILLITTFGVVIFYYHDLPDQIASHYNGFGEPDDYSRKSAIWGLPMVALILYITLTMSTRFPALINYPFALTEENADRQHQNVVLMIRVLKIAIAMLFFYLTYASIQNGLGNMSGLGTLFLPVFLALVFGIVGGFIYRGFKLR